MSKNSTIGIRAFEVYVPEQLMTVDQMADASQFDRDHLLNELGVQQKNIAQNTETPSDMAIAAAIKLLNNQDISASEIDYIVYCSTGIYDHQFWSPAAKVQQAVQADNAFCFEINNGCNAGNLGINFAITQLAQNPSKKNALVIISDKLSSLVDYTNNNHLAMFNYADAATAILISNENASIAVKSFEAATDSSLVDFVYLPQNDANMKSTIVNRNIPDRRKLFQMYTENYPRVINNALKTASLTLKDIKYIFINQGDYKLIDTIAKKLNIQTDKIFLTYANHGHLGGNDTFFGLKQAMQSGLVSSNDHVILASSAIGFSWSASVLKLIDLT